MSVTSAFEVSYYCPDHGEVLATTLSARVWHECGQECAPEGATPEAHRAAYLNRRSSAIRVRRSRNIGTP